MVLAIEKITQDLEPLQMFGEKLYKVADLKRNLDMMDEDVTNLENFLLTPFYFFNGKRYEFYEYELCVVIVEKKDFYGHILNLTGKARVEDVPQEIIERQKVCFAELYENERFQQKVTLKNYITTLFTSKEIKDTVEKIFGSFVEENLYFAIY